MNPKPTIQDQTLPTPEPSSYYSLPDINSKVLAFNNVVTSLFDKHAPFQTFLAKQRPSPWMSLEIKNLLNRRDRARRKFVQTKSSVNYEQFNRRRNTVKQMIRNAKLRYAYSLFPPNLTQDQFYKNVKKILELSDIITQLSKWRESILELSDIIMMKL
uniref:Uncharacterized protein n=1 Tax=Cacopsylla melanoneura TaxID=428564 RepID=A0A8D8S8H0_9HEMI